MPLKYNTDTFIEKARRIYGDCYDYSKTEYLNSVTKVCIICHEKDKYGCEHGEFWVRPGDFLIKKSSCRKCHGNYKPKDINEFWKRLLDKYPVYKDKYEIADDEVYINNKTKIKVFCHETHKKGNEHGEFCITPCDLVNGYGCPICGNNLKKTTKQFIEGAKEKHTDRYNYSKVKYVDAHTKVCIICLKHGEFWQTPNNHLNGSGCPHCNSENKIKKEEEITNMLRERKINFLSQKTFEWLKYKKNLYLDFYLPQYNCAIEYQGEQHFKSVERFGGEKDFEIRKTRDEVKRILCEKHGVKIFYLRGKINFKEINHYINETSRS